MKTTANAKKKSNKKPAMKAKTSLKKAITRKRIKKRSIKPRPYKMPKTAAEHGITCLSASKGKVCGKPVVWFDYELGERDFYEGFVCDRHKVSNRVEKLAQHQVATKAV